MVIGVDGPQEVVRSEMVIGVDGPQEVVRSTVEVAMVFMASNGKPTGVSRSRSTGKIFFYDRVG